MMAEWLVEFDRHVAPKDRNVLLILDSTNVHVSAISELGTTTQLENTVICLLPAEKASKSQPSNTGILDAFKLGYSSSFARFYIEVLDAREVLRQMNILKALKWVLEAWEETKPEIILKSWHKSGLIPAPEKDPLPSSSGTVPPVSCTTPMNSVPTQTSNSVPTPPKSQSPIETVEIIDLEEEEANPVATKPQPPKAQPKPVKPPFSKVSKMSQYERSLRIRKYQSHIDSLFSKGPPQ